MQLIRRLDNPLVVKAFGSVPFGGLGEFDPSIYIEETVENLPQGWVAEPEPLPLIDQVKAYYSGLPIMQRLALAPSIKLILTLMELQDFESLTAVIDDSEFPAQHQQPLKTLLGLD